MATNKSIKKKSGRVDYRHGFNRFKEDIVRLELDKGVVDCLVSKCVLTIEDAESIRQKPTNTSRNEQLLDILQERPYNTFGIFTEVLKDADEELAAEMGDFKIEDVHPRNEMADKSINVEDSLLRYQKSYKTLVNALSSPMKIVDILVTKDTFDNEDSEEISSLMTLQQKNRQLLSKIAYKRSGHNKFMTALKESDDDVDRQLAGKIEITDIGEEDKLLLQIGKTISRERNENISSNVKENTRELEDYWRDEDRAFVETKGTAVIFKKTREKDYITIVGSSGSGKTSAMRHVVLKLKSEERFQIVPVDSPDKIVEYGKGRAKQVFIIDDVIGKYEVDPIALENWEKSNHKIQSCLEKYPGNMKIIFTLRKQVVNNKKFSNSSSIISRNIVDLEDKEFTLSKEEKKEILTKHLRIKGMEYGTTENDIEEVCTLDYAFPLLCRIVSSNDERRKNLVKFFRNPLSVLDDELTKLSTENKYVYCSLVFCMLFNGKVGKEFFDVHLQNDEMFSNVIESCCGETNISRIRLHESLKSVVGTYVSSDNGNFYFIHDSFQEAVSSNFAKVNPDVMFTHCDIDLIRNRVRIGFRLPDDDDNVIVINEEQFEIIANRVLTECEEGRFSNVLLSNFIKNEDFVRYLGTKENRKKQIKVNTLMQNVSVERCTDKFTIYDVLKYCRSLLCCSNKTTEEKKRNELETNNAAIKQVISVPPRQSTLIYWIVATGCHSLFKLFWGNATRKERSKLLGRDLKFPLTKPFFPLAVLGGNVDIIKSLISSGAHVNCFSYEGETPLSITSKSGRNDIATLLIDAGADVNQADMFSHRFPSFICTENNKMDVLKSLLRNRNCDVNLVDIYGGSSLILSVLMERKRDIVTLLLEFDAVDYPLHESILNCDVNGLKTNLQIEDVNSKTKNWLTSLHYATQVNGTVMIRLLLGDHSELTDDETIKVNSVDKNGLTPLHLAVLNDHIEAVKLLVDRNADINAKDKFGRIPLHYSQIPAISSWLLNSRFSASAVADIAQSSSIPVNQSDANQTVVDIHHVEEEQRPMLSWCAIVQNVAWFILPFKACISRSYIDAPDNQGNTPLNLIVQTLDLLQPAIKEKYDRKSNIRLLMNHDANIHFRNDEGGMPSDFALKDDELKNLFTPYTSRVNKKCEKNIQLLSFVFPFLLWIAVFFFPLKMQTDRNENGNLNFSESQNTSHILLQWGYYYWHNIVFYNLVNSVIVIGVAIQLRRTSCRYRIACLIMFFILQNSHVTVLIVLDKFNVDIFVASIFTSSFFDPFKSMVVFSLKKILMLKLKYLQTIYIVVLCVNVSSLIFTVLTFVQLNSTKETASMINKTLELYTAYVIPNGSLPNKMMFAVNATSLKLNTSINCTESVIEQNETPFYNSLMYIIFMSVSYYIYLVLFKIIVVNFRKTPNNSVQLDLWDIWSYCFLFNISIFCLTSVIPITSRLL